MLNPSFDPTLLSRIEDAGLNASAPPQQRWLDGWLLRLSPGKAKRARCINALADGRLPLAEKLASSDAAYRDARLPMFIRITPFSRPADLDRHLAELNYDRIDDTRVMVCADLDPVATDIDLPGNCTLQLVDLLTFAEQVGELRGSPPHQRAAHAQRLQSSPVTHVAMVVECERQVVCCGQIAIENDLAGLYDVVTAPHSRGRGLARLLCRRMLVEAQRRGARHAYLQVESDNLPARSIYARLGFADGYAYHYRSPPVAADLRSED